MATPFDQLLSHPVDKLRNPENIVKLFLVKLYDPSQIHKFTRTEIIFSIIKINELCSVLGAYGASFQATH